MTRSRGDAGDGRREDKTSRISFLLRRLWSLYAAAVAVAVAVAELLLDDKNELSSSECKNVEPSLPSLPLSYSSCILRRGGRLLRRWDDGRGGGGGKLELRFLGRRRVRPFLFFFSIF